MATSSITRNFIISGQKQVEMFAEAIEASANDRTPRVPYTFFHKNLVVGDALRVPV